MIADQKMAVAEYLSGHTSEYLKRHGVGGNGGAGMLPKTTDDDLDCLFPDGAGECLCGTCGSHEVCPSFVETAGMDIFSMAGVADEYKCFLRQAARDSVSYSFYKKIRRAYVAGFKAGRRSSGEGV